MAVHGSKASLHVGSVATPNTADQDLSIYANSVGNHLTRDSAETSTLGKTSKTFIPGLKDGTIPFAGPYDRVSDALLQGLYDGGVVFAFEYCPEGAGVVGSPKYAGSGFLTSYQVTSAVGAANAVSSEIKVSGDVVRTIQ